MIKDIKSTLLWAATFLTVGAFSFHALSGIDKHFPVFSEFLHSHGLALAILAILIYYFWQWAQETAEWEREMDEMEQEMAAADDEIRDHLRSQDLAEIISPEDMEIIYRETR